MKISGDFIGTNLAQLRRARGLTQQELADGADVSLSTVTKLEAGDIKRPSIQTLVQIIKVLDYDLDEFLSGKSLPKTLGKAPTKQAGRKHKGINFVYFDIGGVLVHTESEVLQALSVLLNRPLDQIRAVYYQYVPIACKGKLNMEDLQLLNLLKLNVKFKSNKQGKYFKHWVDYMKPIEATHKLLLDVSKNYSVGLLTDTVEGFVERMQERKLLPDVAYKSIVKSNDEGVTKPDQKIFSIATERAGVAPSKILFIDDKKLNVEGARKHGWHAEWFEEMDPEGSVARIRQKYF